MCSHDEPRDRSKPEEDARTWGGSERDAGDERADRRGRKERILHTRISEDLAEDLRRVAEDLRVPVSNLVRNVLEEAFSVVETVTGNVGDLIEEVMGEAEAVRDRIRQRQHHGRHRQRRHRHRFDREERRREDSAPQSEPATAQAGTAGRSAAAAAEDDVLGWQPLVLAKPQRCERCALLMGRGDSAYASVTSRGVGATWRCEDCVAA